MQPPTEQLQQLADEWAAKLGGKIHVRITLAVEAGPNAGKHWYGAQIGETCGARWSGFRPTEQDAITEAERSWKLDGAPTDPNDTERCKLKARAAELGLVLVDHRIECECSKKG